LSHIRGYIMSHIVCLIFGAIRRFANGTLHTLRVLSSQLPVKHFPWSRNYIFPTNLILIFLFPSLQTLQRITYLIHHQSSRHWLYFACENRVRRWSFRQTDHLVLQRRWCGGWLLKLLQFEVYELLALLCWTALTWGRGKWPRSDQRDPWSKPDARGIMSLIKATLYLMQ